MSRLIFDNAGLTQLLNIRTKVVHLVKDQGIYLFAGDNGKKKVVIYAEGYDPDKDDNWWDDAYAAVGGDDFAEKLMFTPAIMEEIKLGAGIAIDVSPTQIKLLTFRKEQINGKGKRS